jgi:hypothetical protein
MANKLAVAGPDSVYKQPGARLAGFWDGYWHGLIAPITLIIGLFKPGVAMYEVNNTGQWYDVGFFLGISSAVGGKRITLHVGSGQEEQAPPEE